MAHQDQYHWCMNGHEWCSGPNGPESSDEAWGGKCADCYLWPDLGAYRGRYGWNEAYLNAGGASA